MSTSNDYYQMQSSLLAAIELTRNLLREILDSSDDGSKNPGEISKILLSYPSASENPSSAFTLLTLHQDLLQHRIDRHAMSRAVRGKIADCAAHLERLQSRVADRSSRILVTGDVNAGKSTLVNALLRHPNLMPTDQQPCTQSFCEVVLLADGGGDKDNSRSRGMRRICAQSDPLFSGERECAEVTLTLEEMQNDLQLEHPRYPWYQITLGMMTTAPNSLLAPSPLLSFQRVKGETGSSLALIDSPGLNSDLFSKTKVFAHQDDLDAIIFVINAANHLTLSAREFLERAAREKAFIFVVVNKFDEIGNQEKCRRMVLHQISQVLPATHRHADELVHFVSARYILQRYITQDFMDGNSPKFNQVCLSEEAEKDFSFKSAFEECERALCRFLLEKRARSKLLPAKTYLQHLLGDLEGLLGWNQRECSQKIEALGLELEMITPCYEDLVSHEAPLRHDLQSIQQQTRRQVCEETERLLGAFVLGGGKESKISMASLIGTAPWAGILQVWRWRDDLMGEIEGQAARLDTQARQQAIEQVLAARHLLTQSALSHAPRSVWEGGRGPVTSFEDCSAFFSIDQLPPPLVIPRPPAWDLIGIGWPEMISSPWIGAATIGGAIFGYQPLISLTWRLLEVFLMRQAVRPSRFSSICLVLGVVGAAGGLVAWFAGGGGVGLEGLVRRRLLVQCQEALQCEQDSWVGAHVRALDGASASALTATTGSLLARFEEALLRQRRLRAQKDLERCQTQSLLARLHQYRQRVGQLKVRIESIES